MNCFFYRFWQFKQALFSKLDYTEWNQAISVLPSNLQTILNRLKNPEKAHVLRICTAINNSNLKESDKTDMLQLALLHDIGKTVTKPNLLTKVLRVILLRTDTAHCIAGAKILRSEKCDKQLILRVLRHHDQTNTDPVLRFFQEFDNSN